MFCRWAMYISLVLQIAMKMKQLMFCVSFPNGWLDWLEMEVTFVHGYIILGDQPNVAPKGYLMGKGSITPLDHFEKYWVIHKDRRNFCYPLGVEELKGFQLQNGFAPLEPLTLDPAGGFTPDFHYS